MDRNQLIDLMLILIKNLPLSTLRASVSRYRPCDKIVDMNKNTLVIIVIVIVVALLGYIFFVGTHGSEGDEPVNQDPSFQTEDVVVRGEVSRVDSSQVPMDGPYVIYLDTKDGEETILISSFGRNLCEAREDIIDIDLLEPGATVEVRGAENENGHISPCASEEHYVRVLSEAEKEIPTYVVTPTPIPIPTPEPEEPAYGLPYCNVAFEEHREIAQEYVKQFDDPRVADDEYVIWSNTATGVGRCNNGNTQSTRFLFGYGEILTDDEGNPRAYLGYLVVNGDSSEVTIFERCDDGSCVETGWCTPVYGPSYCNDGECTDDEVFKGCQS